MKKKIDWYKVLFAISFIVSITLLINKIMASGTIFCLTTIYK